MKRGKRLDRLPPLGLPPLGPEAPIERAPDAPPEPPDAWDRTAAWIAKHGALPALALLTIAVGLIYSGVFRGEVKGDDLTFHMAESRRIADCIAAGDWDFWNPSANAGYASAYYYQVIPQLASALPAALFGHHTFFFQLSVWLPLALAPVAAYRGVRIMGASPWQATTAAFVLAFTIGQSRWGFQSEGTFFVGLYTQTWALAAFPLALGHSVRWLTDSRGLAPAIAWATFVGLCHPFGGVSLALGLTVAVAVGLAWKAITAREKLSWGEPARLVILGAALAIATLPGWITMLVDKRGFGGFPHRVDDEVGPGFGQLLDWFAKGWILDFGRVIVLTCVLPFAIAFGRGKQLRWLWAPAAVFALLLGLGPNMPKTADDLIPAVRFLGAMQVVLALGIGIGAFTIARWMWEADETTWFVRSIRAALSLTGEWVDRLGTGALQFGIRTGIAMVVAGLFVFTIKGARVEIERVGVLQDQPNHIRDQMFEINAALAAAPPGRKQVGPGCENHWWNLLSYVYDRVPSLLQMGGGGLQASPNYDYLWSVRDFPKLAWVYDTPYLEFEKVKGGSLPVGESVIETTSYAVRKLPAPGLVSPIQITGVLPDGPTGNNTPVRKKAIDWLRTDAPMKNQHLAYFGSGGPGPAPAGTVLRFYRQPSPGDAADIVAITQATAPTTYVVRESWHPRWHAYVDGAEVPVRRVTPDFPAVDMPAGKHVLQLRFERPWWATASWLAWPAVVLLAFFGLRFYRRRFAPA